MDLPLTARETLPTPTARDFGLAALMQKKSGHPAVGPCSGCTATYTYGGPGSSSLPILMGDENLLRCVTLLQSTVALISCVLREVNRKKGLRRDFSCSNDVCRASFAVREEHVTGVLRPLRRAVFHV